MRKEWSSLTSTILVLFLLLIVPAANAAAGWSKTYGGPDRDIARSIVQTNDGGYALAGFTESYGAGESDFWLVKVDSSGNMQWNHAYGGPQEEDAYCVIQTSDGGYAISGYTGSYGPGDWNYWLVKTDSLGNLQWNRTYSALVHTSMWDGQAKSVVQTEDGGYALAGFVPGQYGYDFGLVKVDASGDVQWNMTYAGLVYTSVFLIRTDDGGYVVAGTSGLIGEGFWLIKVDSSGNEVWDKAYVSDSLYSAVQTMDGGYLMVGELIIQGLEGTQHDALLIKVDSSGNELWNRTYGGSEDDAFLCVIQTSNGDYAFAGYTKPIGSEETDSWFAKVDSSGNMLWNRTYGGIWSDSSSSIIQTTDGGYALVGDLESHGISDFWLIKTDETGIIPEFPSLLAVSFLLVATSLVIMVSKRKSPSLHSS